MSTVYAVFLFYGEGDSGAVYHLIDICTSIESAKQCILEVPQNYLDVHFERMDLVHPNMSPENIFTHIGNRPECKKSCCFLAFGGFVIEQITVREFIPETV